MPGTKKTIRYGYASAPDPERLQDQVEALEDMGIADTSIYAEINNKAHTERTEWDRLIGAVRRSRGTDACITVADMTALGSTLSEICERLSGYRSYLDIAVPPDSPWKTAEQMIESYLYIGKRCREQSENFAVAGKPRKPYPAGWRDIYKKYMCRQMKASEIRELTGMTDYDIFRCINRYKERERKKGL